MYKKYPVAILHHHAKVVSMGDGLLTTHKLLAMATLAALLNAAVSLAQEPFPAEPIDIVTHASPGGGTDATARAMAVVLSIAITSWIAKRITTTRCYLIDWSSLITRDSIAIPS